MARRRAHVSDRCHYGCPARARATAGRRLRRRRGTARRRDDGRPARYGSSDCSTTSAPIRSIQARDVPLPDADGAAWYARIWELDDDERRRLAQRLALQQASRVRHAVAGAQRRGLHQLHPHPDQVRRRTLATDLQSDQQGHVIRVPRRASPVDVDRRGSTRRRCRIARRQRQCRRSQDRERWLARRLAVDPGPRAASEFHTEHADGVDARRLPQ